MKKIIWCLLMLYQSFSWANGDYQDIAIQSKQELLSQARRYQSEANDFLSRSTSMNEVYRQEAASIQHQLIPSMMNNLNRHNKKEDNSKSSILIFVSFSMPEKSLEAILYDAKKIGASVIIRGLVGDSFQQTFKRVAHLNKQSGGNGVELNPILFKEFRIKSVPTVAVIANQTCLTKHYCQLDKEVDFVTGDISLEAALKIVRDRGISKEIAQTGLARLRGGFDA